MGQYFLFIKGWGPGVVFKFVRLASQIRPPLWHSSFKKTYVSSPPTRRDSVLWVASVTESSASDRQDSNF